MRGMIEKVSDYPRPPRLERVSRHIQIVFGGAIVADTRTAWRVLETFHPPTYYLPPDSFAPGALVAAPGSSFCEWKGHARYWSVRAGDRIANRAAWSYAEPSSGFAGLRDHVAIYAAAMDFCTVDGEKVRPQPGGFYGGWVTDDLVGPFKGGPGTEFW